jgi:hypothetical protein
MAVRAEAPDRSWISNPLRLEVRPIPASGRPATFSGGVGPVRLETHWSRADVRQGDVVELEVAARGDGAVGQDRPFSVAASGATSALIGKGDLETSLIPPLRIERFRVRALEPGLLRFDPLVCSTFDPVTGRFSTSSAPIPSLDVRPMSGRVAGTESGPASAADEPRWGGRAITTAIWVAGPLAALAFAFMLRRARRTGARWTRFARAMTDVRSWDSSEPPATVARRTLELLADLLRRPGEGGPAVLTPDDARAAWSRWLGDDALARDAEGLAARCEQSLYGGPGSTTGDPTAWNEARRAEVLSLLAAARKHARRRRIEL